MLGILVQLGAFDLPPSVFAWSVTVILPINSAINPYLYTIVAVVNNWRKVARKRKTSSNQRQKARKCDKNRSVKNTGVSTVSRTNRLRNNTSDMNKVLGMEAETNI